MERIATNDGKVKAVSDCKWTEGKSHRWRRFVQFVGRRGWSRDTQVKRYSIRGNERKHDRSNRLFVSRLFRRRIFFTSRPCVEIIWKYSRWKSWSWRKGIVEGRELSKIQPVAKMCRWKLEKSRGKRDLEFGYSSSSCRFESSFQVFVGLFKISWFFLLLVLH